MFSSYLKISIPAIALLLAGASQRVLAQTDSVTLTTETETLISYACLDHIPTYIPFTESDGSVRTVDIGLCHAGTTGIIEGTITGKSILSSTDALFVQATNAATLAVTGALVTVTSPTFYNTGPMLIPTTEVEFSAFPTLTGSPRANLSTPVGTPSAPLQTSAPGHGSNSAAMPMYTAGAASAKAAFPALAAAGVVGAVVAMI